MQIEKYQYGGSVPGMGGGLRPGMRRRPGIGGVNAGLRNRLGSVPRPGMVPRRPRPGGASPLRHPGGPGGYHVRYKKGGKVK